MDAFLVATGRLRAAGLAAAATLAVLAACRKPDPKPEPVDPPEYLREHYAEAIDRLTSKHLEDGWVVSRLPDGSPEHVGDALIWTGLLLSALPCELGDPIESHLVDVINRHGGALVRYEPLGDYANGREASADGALGLYRGIAHRIEKCGRAEVWRSALADHFNFVEANDGRLNPFSTATLEVFQPVLALLAHSAGVSGASHPGVSCLRDLRSVVTAWAAAVNVKHAACFRVHLGWEMLRTFETLGEDTPDEARSQFCMATTGMDIPLIDNWCGRGDLKAWIDGFEYDQWEFRHQRCGSWESPDGDGDSTPGLDLLMAMTEAYNL